MLDDDATVYKLIGPVLVKQDLTEARQNVDKRIDYIKTEMFVLSCFSYIFSYFPIHNCKKREREKMKGRTLCFSLILAQYILR
ncbi:unnamed protein product, partial [Toxocara canis]